MRGTGRPWLVRTARIHRFLAGFSFSRYLIHYPVMIALLSLAFNGFAVEVVREGFQPDDPKGFPVFAVIFLVVVAVSHGFALLTERRTLAGETFLKRRLGMG